MRLRVLLSSNPDLKKKISSECPCNLAKVIFLPILQGGCLADTACTCGGYVSGGGRDGCCVRVCVCACVLYFDVYALCNNIHLRESFPILHLLTCCVFCALKVATIAAERRTRNRERRKRRGRRGEGWRMLEKRREMLQCLKMCLQLKRSGEFGA